MIERIDPRLLHPENRFFLDYVRGEASALALFERSPVMVEDAADARRWSGADRDELARRLRAYNERLTFSPAVRSNIDALAKADAFCVIGGQQAGFLGGPLFTAYKIVSVLRAAAWLAARLAAPVVPVFWLASEDHDFTEINRVRLLDAEGRLRAISFEWDGRGRPIERLPITAEARTALAEALELFSPAHAAERDLFLPEAADDYAMWHARIWSRLFGPSGLVLVEPRTIRGMAGPFFADALSSARSITTALAEAAGRLRRLGYDVPIEPDRAGGLFELSDEGRRVRVLNPADHVDRGRRSPDHYSPDAALRPLLADALFPTIASVVGASELSYHAMLQPVYRLFGIAQPLLFPRQGFTLLSTSQAALLDRCGLRVSDVLTEGFDPAAVVRSSASPALLAAFAERRTAVRASLDPLREPLGALDPGLVARWRQAADRVEQQIDQLEERAVRTDLGRRGISLLELRRLAMDVLPTGKPQERVLSLVDRVAQHGTRWLFELEATADPGEYAHYAVTLGESHA